MVRLSDVMRRLAAAHLLVDRTDADPEIAGVTDDSRSVHPGDLFCAWKGTSFDSHDAVTDVAGAGAAAALVERHVAASIPQVLVNDGRRAAAVGAAAVLGDPQDSFRLAGVTGTNGKTTTVWLLRHVLSGRWHTAALGTLGVILDDGSVLEGSEALTTPGPVQLARTLRLLVDRGIEAVALETSSHALDQGRVDALRFDVVVFTNLSRDHLDYHGTLEAYLEAKLALLKLVKVAGCAVVNADDPAWAPVSGRVRHILRFGFEPDADVRADAVQLNEQGAQFECTWRGVEFAVKVPLLGAFNVQNALAAIAAALSQGMTPDEIVARLATVPQVPGRLERIASSPCPVLRDYAHTPDALERVLATLRPLVRGRLIAVFGAGGDRDRGKRPLMGAVAQRGADLAIVTSDNPRTEDPDTIIDEIIAGMSASPVRITDRRAAIAHALHTAQSDDLVLLAGKGHETYQVLGHSVVPFDERVVVREVLAQEGLA
jgi:UDP-N-acetylmuramoyl-L-alanyl-D-glutamate--2,6-diaminopimelate ligase